MDGKTSLISIALDHNCSGVVTWNVIPIRAAVAESELEAEKAESDSGEARNDANIEEQGTTGLQ